MNYETESWVGVRKAQPWYGQVELQQLRYRIQAEGRARRAMVARVVVLGAIVLACVAVIAVLV